MNPLHWTWAAIVADIGLLFSPAMLSTGLLAFWCVLLAHTTISALVAVSTYLLLPRRFRQPRTFVTGLMFCFAFIAPVVGAIGLLIIIRRVLQKTHDESIFAVPVPVELPVYDMTSKDVHRGSSQGAIRSRLGHEVPSHLRMQSLLTLQAVPSRVSNPILEELLGDDTDDVRLVAFGMLDTEEKKISSEIRQQSERLEQAQTLEVRFGCLRQLAELNWELVYACLAQGELRRHILTQAARFADEALALDVSSGSGLVFLRGRIWLEQGDLDAAKLAIEQAVAQGQPRTSAWPYLAEIAFRRRDFIAVRQYMQQLSKLNLASRTQMVEDFWVSRPKEINFRDYTYLPHI
jgi:polysaccharide biosynthesis protein PelE